MDRHIKNITIVSSIILAFYILILYFHLYSNTWPQAVIIANEMFMLLFLLLTVCILLFWIVSTVSVKSIKPYRYIAMLNVLTVGIILFMIFYIG